MLQIKEQAAIISRGGTVTSLDRNVFTFHLTTLPYGQFITRLNTNTRANNKHLNSPILLSFLSIMKRTNSIFFFQTQYISSKDDIKLVSQRVRIIERRRRSIKLVQRSGKNNACYLCTMNLTHLYVFQRIEDRFLKTVEPTRISFWLGLNSEIL